MRMSWEDVVLIEEGKTSGDPTVLTVNCPDKAGLGCDLLRIVLEFGLYVTRGDFSTDGKWCYIVLWVVPCPISLRVDWENLNKRLLSCCPSFLPTFYLNQLTNGSKPPSLYLLTVLSLDRKGLLHDVTEVLCERDLSIQRVKVTTTPDGKVLDLFFITDAMSLQNYHTVEADPEIVTYKNINEYNYSSLKDQLHTKIRCEETCKHLRVMLGECCISCELQLAGPEYDTQQGHSCISEEVAEELFSSVIVGKDDQSNEASITVDNQLSPTHTLLQIKCLDQNGLIYDALKIFKDCDIRVLHGRFYVSVNGYRNLDLFIQKEDGKGIADKHAQAALCSRLKEEMLHPLRVIITNRGPDTELLVANRVELSGKGRPRVFYDITLALKKLRICVFSAEIGRHSASNHEWEVYRFLLDETEGLLATSNTAKRDIVYEVSRTLMGW